MAGGDAGALPERCGGGWNGGMPATPVIDPPPTPRDGGAEEHDMALTLPQRLYLLSYDLDRNRLDPVSAACRDHLLSAAALVELVLGGWVRDQGGRAVRTGVGAPGDSFLVEVLAGVSTDRPRPWVNAVMSQMTRAEGTVRGQLAAGGAVTVGRGRVLGLFPTRTVAPGRPEELRRLRERIRGAVLSGRDPQAVPIEDAALAVIAVEGDVWTLLAPKERRRHRKALRALRDRFDAEFPRLRRAICMAVAHSRSA
ncbi:GPP34 family phosphoprotein [Nocardiopsis composta]